jgi:hypothetical protein
MSYASRTTREHKTPESNKSERFNPFGLLQEQTIDKEGGLEEAIVLLRAMLFFIRLEHLLSAMASLALGRPIGEQHEAAGLCTPACNESVALPEC